MVEFMIFAVIVGGGCWGFKQWLAYQERQQIVQRLDTRQRETGKVIDVTEVRQLFDATRPVKLPGGANKWLVMGLCAFYIIFPIDFIPDFIPVLGWGDDLAAAVIGLRAMFK
jgi:uncharacterized membrane protein YkvA (DUF1232 family)